MENLTGKMAQASKTIFKLLPNKKRGLIPLDFVLFLDLVAELVF